MNSQHHSDVIVSDVIDSDVIMRDVNKPIAGKRY